MTLDHQYPNQIENFVQGTEQDRATGRFLTSHRLITRWGHICLSEMAIYEHVLSQSWSNYMFYISEQYDMAIQDFMEVCSRDEKGQIPATVKMSEILPSDIPSQGLPKTASFRSDQRLEPDSQREGQSCSHCSTTKTSLWRRRGGRLVCNACALYEKLHGEPRPAHLLNQDIRKRNRTDPNRRCR